MHFNDVLSLAARAWHEIKPAGDPEFNQCQITHRENLGAAAQAVVNSGRAFTPFDKAVLRIYQADAAAKSEADKILANNPTLHADEVMHIASGTPHPLAGHAENAQMAAVREEFRGVDTSGFVTKVDLSSGEQQIAIANNKNTPITVHGDGEPVIIQSGESETFPRALKGPLPKDFPAHDLLHAAGINTYTQLSKVEDLTSIDGIGPATAEKIADRLAEDAKGEN